MARLDVVAVEASVTRYPLPSGPGQTGLDPSHFVFLLLQEAQAVCGLFMPPSRADEVYLRLGRL